MKVMKPAMTATTRSWTIVRPLVKGLDVEMVSKMGDQELKKPAMMATRTTAMPV